MFRDSLDEIVGVLHVRDLFAAMHDFGIANVSLEAIVRPAYVVPETRISPLLADFRREKQHMAIVIDEYGAMEGIATLEDLLEEIVGEIEDEFDLPDTSVERVDEKRIRIGRTASTTSTRSSAPSSRRKTSTRWPGSCSASSGAPRKSETR